MGARQLIAGRFKIVTCTNRGPVALYHARDADTGDEVAVKTVGMKSSIDTEYAREAIRHEAELLASLSHPRFQRYIAHGTLRGGEPYLATQWLEGVDLIDYLDEQWREGVDPEAGQPPALEARKQVTIARGVAEALAALHRLGLVHRDVNPTNIFLEGRDVDRIKLLNLERVRRVNAPKPHGEFWGNPTFMAPEQMRSERVDARADIFALGAVLFYGLTGQYPHGGSVRELFTQRLTEDAPRLAEFRPDVPRELDDLVARMLARAPERRPRDGAALFAELAHIEFAPR